LQSKVGKDNDYIDKSYLKFSKIDIVLCFILIVLAIITFYKFASYPLPVGYDTPIYLEGAKIIAKKGIKVLDFRLLLFFREIYVCLLGLILLLIRDEIILGKFLWLQITFILIVNYFLVSRIAKSRLLGFVSSFIWIFWTRTSRILSDLHASTFGLFVLLLSYLTMFYSFSRKSRKLFLISIFLVIFLWFIHQLIFIVGFVSYISFLILDVSFNVNSIVFYFLRIRNESFKRFVKILILSFPLILFLVIYSIIRYFGLFDILYYAATDMLRQWWPEVPIWMFHHFVDHLGGWPIFLFGEIGVLYILLLSYRNSIYNLLFINLIVALLMEQNFLFGLHALPERFANAILMPIYSSFGIFFISKEVAQYMRKIKIKIEFGQRIYTIGIESIIIVLLAGILSLYMIPLQLDEINKYRPTITIEEYNAMHYLRDTILSFLEPTKSQLIILPRWGMEMWIRTITAGNSGKLDAIVMQNPSLEIIKYYLEKYDIIFLFEMTIDNVEAIANYPRVYSVTITYGAINIQIISKDPIMLTAAKK
jgi:hypothetical protein